MFTQKLPKFYKAIILQFKLHRYLKAFTLIEALIALSISMLVIQTSTSIFFNLSHVKLHNFHDIPICLYHLACDISYVSHVEVYDDIIYLHNGDEISKIYLDDGRLVRTPGFVIYCHDIEDVRFYHDHEYVYANLKRGDEIALFKIGVYYRPSERICELDESDSIISDDVVIE